MMTEVQDIAISIQPTPNPNALKFMSNHTLKTEGNSTYRTPMECQENPMAQELFTVRGVDSLHFYDNVVTVTKFNYEEWENIEDDIIQIMKTHIPKHNPDYFDPDPEADRRRSLTPELQEIEKIFDKTIRPGLQADGGDIQALSLEDNILLVRYQGACGTCPSSTMGTLEAIKGILRDEFNPDIDVYIAPDY